MKVLIISDIHGNYDDLKKVLENEKYDQLVILGDLFSYGYSSFENKNKIINLLEKNKYKLTLIKGNCDHALDIIKQYDIITLSFNKRMVTFTHGHIYSKSFIPDKSIDIFIQGHTHVPELYKEYGIIYANPGSITYPRYGTKKSYMIYEEDKITIKSINGDIIKEMTL